MAGANEEGGDWGDLSGVGVEVARAVSHLNSQHPRTCCSDGAANRSVIEYDVEGGLGDGLASARAEEGSVGGGSSGGGGRVAVEGIRYIDEASVPRSEFDACFAAVGEPCMVRGCCEEWPARRKWASGEVLSSSHGDMMIRITEHKDHPTASARPLRVPIKNYCAYAMRTSADFPWYGFDDDFVGGREALVSDFEVPLYFRDDCYDVSEEARHVFPKNLFFIVGGTRTGTPLHIDPNSTSAWNSLLCGRKRWILFPPGSDRAYLDLLGVEEEYSRKLTPPCKWWRDDYERIRSMAASDLPEGFRMIECVQHPGETIFVPWGWWHAVLNLDFTVAITANALLPASLHGTWHGISAAYPRSFLVSWVKQIAAKWPEHVFVDGRRDGASTVSDDLVDLASNGLEGDLQEDGGVAGEGGEDEECLKELRRFGELQKEGGVQCVLFVDADGVLKDACGGLRPASLIALQHLSQATRAELVLTSACRSTEVSRQPLKDALNRWGLDFSRWITTADLPGGRSSQILDFVTKQQLSDFAVVDCQQVGDAQGLMLQMMLHSRCLVVDKADGLTLKDAVAIGKILLDDDDDGD